MKATIIFKSFDKKTVLGYHVKNENELSESHCKLLDILNNICYHIKKKEGNKMRTNIFLNQLHHHRRSL